MLFWCCPLPLPVWFVIGLFFGPPLSILHKHMLDSRHAARVPSLPQSAIIVPEYHERREETAVRIEIHSAFDYQGYEDGDFQPIVSSDMMEEVEGTHVQDVDYSIRSSAELSAMHDGIAARTCEDCLTDGLNTVSNEEARCKSSVEIEAEEGVATVIAILHQANGTVTSPKRDTPEDIGPAEESDSKTTASPAEDTILPKLSTSADTCPSRDATQHDASKQHGTFIDEVPSSLPLLPVSTIHDKPFSQHMYQHLRRILLLPYRYTSRYAASFIGFMHPFKSGAMRTVQAVYQALQWVASSLAFAFTIHFAAFFAIVHTILRRRRSAPVFRPPANGRNAAQRAQEDARADAEREEEALLEQILRANQQQFQMMANLGLL